ncbi:hypothetical protein ACOSQ2_025077 [Xanthoceras sorbifolium]
MSRAGSLYASSTSSSSSSSSPVFFTIFLDCDSSKVTKNQRSQNSRLLFREATQPQTAKASICESLFVSPRISNPEQFPSLKFWFMIVRDLTARVISRCPL